MHIPVLLKETIECLNPQKNENFVDCTINGGGHTKEILKRTAPNGKVLGIEWDFQIYENILKQNIERLEVVNRSYTELEKIIIEKNFKDVAGVLFDLGMSSFQIEESGKGFSFNRNEPLIMTYGNIENTAEKILNSYNEEELEKIIREYGEEKFSKKIAKAIIKARKTKPLKTTFDLVEIIRQVVPIKYQYRKTHFATRTFQAIRIEANQELENLKIALPQAVRILKPGGRLAIISFHSLEDRIVKNFFKNQEKEKQIKIITKKPIIASEEEIIKNPRARGAKLRAIIKCQEKNQNQKI